MEGMNGPLRGDRSLRGHESLRDDLSAKDAADPARLATAPIEVGIQFLDVEQVDEVAILRVKDGRFVPYATDGTTNATLRKDDDPETITLERAAELLADKRAKGPVKKTAKKAAARKTAPAKKTAVKKAAVKKTAAKRTAASEA